MRRLLKEPLVHFVALGALLFAGYSVLNRNDRSAPAPGRIVVSQGQLAAMMETFSRTRQRPPTPEEWQALIADRVREEVYCREALALSLDKDDTIIRRRLRQKMEFVSDDIAALTPPTDAELNEYLQAHPDMFRVERRYTFRQLYLDPAKHGENLARVAMQLLAALNEPGAVAGPGATGDPFMLEGNFTAATAAEVAGQLGEEFASNLDGLPPGEWRGPVESAFGMHLVFVSERLEGHLPPLADVRNAVLREWESSRRVETNERLYQELLKRYTVIIEEPASAEAPAARRSAAK